MFQIRVLSFLTALMALMATAHAQTGSSLEKMGGSISDAETQDEIFLSCTELNRDQECLSYQFYFKTGEIKLPLGKKLLPAEFKSIYDTFKQNITAEINKIDQNTPRPMWKLNLFLFTRKFCTFGGKVEAFGSNSVPFTDASFSPEEKGSQRVGSNILACMALGLTPIYGQLTFFTASWVTMPIDVSIAAVKTPIVLLRNALVAISNSQNKKDTQKSAFKLTTAIKNTYDQKSQTTQITHAEFNTLKSIIETQLK